MRVHHRSIGQFVPGYWTVPQNPVTGGMGDFVAGKFTVPQNPVGLGDFVPGQFTVPQNPVLAAQTGGLGRLADFVPGKFTVPQTPVGIGNIDPVLSVMTPESDDAVRNTLAWLFPNFPPQSGLYGLRGLGCGGSSQCGPCQQRSGMSGIAGLSSISGITDTISQIPSDFINGLQSGDSMPWVVMGLGGLLIVGMLTTQSKFQVSRRKR